VRERMNKYFYLVFDTKPGRKASVFLGSAVCVEDEIIDLAKDMARENDVDFKDIAIQPVPREGCDEFYL
jgi:hypothetical protein